MVDPIKSPEAIAQLDEMFKVQGGNPFPHSRRMSPETIAYFDTLFGAAPQVPQQSAFSAGVERGIEHLKSVGPAFGALVTKGVREVFDLPPTSDAGFLESALIDEYLHYAERAEAIPDPVPRIEEVRDLSSFGTWLASRLGEQVPNIIGFLLSYGAGGLIAYGAKRGAMSAAEVAVAQQVAQRVVPAHIIHRGQLLGGGAFATIAEGGGMAGEQISENLELSPGVTLPASLVAGALETTGIALAMKAFGLGPAYRLKFMDKLKKLPLASRVAATGAIVGVGEAGTELAQEINALVVREIVDENFDSLGEEGRSRLLNASAAGFAVGGTVGGAGGIFPGRRRQSDETGTEVPESNVGAATSTTPPTRVQAAPDEVVLEEAARRIAPAQQTLPIGLVPQTPTDPLAIQNIQRMPALSPESEYVANLLATLQRPVRATGEEIDAQVLDEGETRVERLVGDEVQVVPLSEGPQVEVSDTVRESQQDTDTDDLIAAIQQMENQAARLDRDVSPEELNVMEDVSDTGEVSYRNLNVTQSRRFQQLNEKLEEDGDLSEANWIAYERLLAIAEKEEAIEKTGLNKEEQKELEELGKEIQDNESIRQSRAGDALPNNSQEHLRMVQDLVDQLNAKFPNAPNPVVVRHRDTAGDRTVYNEGRGAKGLFVHRGSTGEAEIYIFSNANHTPMDVITTYLHEVLGHGGIRALFTTQELREFLRLVKLPKGVEPTFKNADEYVAEMAEGFARGDKLKSSAFAKVAAFFRKWLRKILKPFGIDVTLSNEEIAAVLRHARAEFMGPVTPRNWAQLRNAKSPKTLAALRQNENFIMRFMDHVPLGKRQYINLGSIESALNKVNANAQERAVVDDILNTYNLFENTRITWQTFMRDLEARYMPLERIQLGNELDVTPREETFEDIMGGTEGLTFFNDVTAGIEDTFSTEGIDYLPSHFNKVRLVSYEADVALTRAYKQSDIQPMRLHFARPNQFGFVHEADAPTGERLIVRMQSDPGQGHLTQEQHDQLAERIRKLDREVMNVVSAGRKGFPFERVVEAFKRMKPLMTQLPKVNTFFNNVVGTAEKIKAIHQQMAENPTKQHVGPLPQDLRINKDIFRGNAQNFLGLAMGNLNVLQARLKFQEESLDAGTFDVQENFPNWQRRLFRETLKQAALDGKKTLWVPSADRVHNIEFGTTVLLRPDQQTILRKHKQFYDWVRKQHKNREGFLEDDGFIKIPVLPEDHGPVTVLARRMTSMFGNLGIPPDDSTPYAADMMSGMWEFFKVKFSKLFLTPLQIGIRYDLPEIRDYLDNGVAPWWNTKMKIISNVDDLVTDWNKLDKTRADRLSKAIIQISMESDDRGRRLLPSRLVEIFRQHNLDQESIELYERVDNEFQKLLDRLELGLLRNEVRIERGLPPDEFLNEWRATQDQQQRAAIAAKYDISHHLFRSLTKMEKDFNEMRNRNYFPYIRFGRYTITASANEDLTWNGKKFKKGSSVFMYTYESRAEQIDGQKDHEAAFRDPRLKVTISKLDDTEMMFSGLPPSVMRNMEEVLELTESQRENLKHLFVNMSPGRSFMKHLQRRSGLEGFSHDTLRAFSSYMFSAANHIARIEHYLDMTKSLERLADLRKSDEYQDSVVIQELSSYFKQHYKYIMNPGTDLAHIRALGFMWYLGGNVKSAAVNLTQVPMVAYPYLAARFNNDSFAVSSLAKAMRDIASGEQGSLRVTRVENEALTRAIEEGFIDESQVTELAGMGESHVLARIMPTHYVERGINKMTYAAGWLFHKAELFNRRVTFLAAYRMALAQRSDTEFAYQEAKRAVQSAQFEYAKWNRPTFMRGNKSVIFLFWQFMQHASFLAMGGEGKGVAMRMLMMLLLAGGLQGLPFAENILDLIDFGATKTREMLGMKDPKVELRQELRELIMEFSDNPDVFMHGAGRYLGLGPFHIFATLGIPVPEVDVTASLSMGRVIPGLEDMLESTRDPEKKFARTIVEMGGPVVGIGWNFYRWATVEEPDEWKSMERTLPTALKNVSKAIRLRARGEETNRSGATIAAFEPGSPEQQAELAAQALGFAPTRLAQKYELLAAQEEARRYWLTKRARMLEHYSYAVVTGDREGIADAKKAIKKFNKLAPTPQLHIRGQQMSQSVKIKRSKIKDMESGQANQRMFRPLYRDVQQAFPEVSSQQ